MQYDPIKQSLGNVFNKATFLRIFFYKLLDLLLLRTWHVKSELRKLKSDLSGKINILDAGSGFGQYSFYMARKYPSSTILAVDIKQEQIDDCKDFFKKINLSDRVRFENQDLTTFTSSNDYHLILSVDVMEHIEEDVVVFKNLYSSLKKGGILIISTPSDQGGSDVHGEGDASFIDEHVRDGYNILEIEDKLKEAGFSTVIARYSYGPPGQISWRLSMKYPILMLNASRLFFIILPFYYLVVYPFVLVLNFIDVRRRQSSGTGLIVKAIK